MANIFRRDRHLASAIICTEIEFVKMFKNDRSKLKREHIELVKKHEDLLDYDYLRFQADFCKVIQSKPEIYGNAPRPALAKSVLVALRVLSASEENWVFNSSSSVVRDVGPDDIITEEMVLWHDWKHIFERIYKRSCNTSKMCTSFSSGSISIDFFGDLVVLKHGGKKILGTYHQLLGVKSLVSSHFSALLYAKLSDIYEKYPGISLYNTVKEFLEKGREDLIKLGNSYHNIVKAVPSLAIANILERSEVLVRNTLLSTVKGPLEKYKSKVVEFLTRPIAGEAGVHVLLEVSGLWKSHGHCVIDTVSSANNFMDLVQSGPEVNQSYAKMVRNMFVKCFCKEYFRINKRWPSLIQAGPVPGHILSSIKTSTWDEIGIYGWTHEDFDNLTFDKTLDFDYFIDTSDLLSDKATSAGRSNWMNNFDRKAYHSLYSSSAPFSSKDKTRVIPQYLAADSPKVEEVIQSIEDRSLSFDNYVIEGVFKEKESKIDKARPFVKLTYSMRLWQTSTEKNIADKIFPYIPFQSMTMDEKTLLETISKVNSNLSGSDVSHAFITFDYSKWCVHFTWESTYHLFRELDNLFGFNSVYLFTHEFPMMSQVILQDRYNPPESDSKGMPFETPFSTRHNKRLMEGMRQKGWTLFTCLIMYSAASQLGTEAFLLGQGDNQTVLLSIPHPSVLRDLDMSVQTYIDAFLGKVSEISSEVGMELKMDETWVSTNLFEYGKKYHYRGVEVSSGLKRASKISSETNSGLPTLSNSISSLFSGGISTSGCDSSPQPGFVLACVEAAVLLSEEDQSLSILETAALLMIPRHLGGLPVVNYAGFCYRGQMDPLTSAISLVNTCYHSDRELWSKVSSFLRLSPSNRRDLLLLIKDPFSLCIYVPMQPENMIRKELRDSMEVVVENKDIKPLFSYQSKVEEEKLVKDLSGVSPFNPRLANMIYQLSNVSLVERIVGRFASSKSVRGVIERRTGHLTETRFREIISELDRNCLSDYKARLRSPEKPDLETLWGTKSHCSSQIASFLRNNTWGMDIQGITMPAPNEQVFIGRWNDDAIEPLRSILVEVSKGDRLTSTRGPYHPFLGSKTQMRTKKSSLEVVDTNSITTSLQKILSLQPWVSQAGEVNLAALFKVLLEEKTNLSIEDIKSFSPTVVGGSVTHRIQDTGGPRGSMINGRYNFNTHCRVVTDTALSFAKGALDYTICFQSVILASLSRLGHEYGAGEDVHGKWALSLNCRGCTRLIDQDIYTLDKPPTYRGVPIGVKIDKIKVRGSPSQSSTSSPDPRREMSSYMAQKWASFIKHWSKDSLETSIESGNETPLPAFVNLTEMCRVEVDVLVRMTALDILLSTNGHITSVKTILDGFRIFPTYGPIGVMACAIIQSDTFSQMGGEEDDEGIYPSSIQDMSRAILRNMKSFLENLESDDINIVPSNSTPEAMKRRQEILFKLDKRGLPMDFYKPTVARPEGVVSLEVREMGQFGHHGVNTIVPLGIELRDPTSRSIAFKRRSSEVLTSCWMIGVRSKSTTDIIEMYDRIMNERPERFIVIGEDEGDWLSALFHSSPPSFLEGSMHLEFSSDLDKIVEYECMEDIHLRPRSIRGDRCAINMDEESMLRAHLSGVLPTINKDDLILCTDKVYNLLWDRDICCKWLVLCENRTVATPKWRYLSFLEKKCWIFFENSDMVEREIS
ncbi:RNA-dependent RNA polymerase, partial [Beihai rhabdo-like virus 3]